jgi:TRAP-type mannitol/chloroaromatic compound transport system permease small subunit
MIDRVNTVIGQIFSWCIVLLTTAVTYEVIQRYVMNAPTRWGFDASYMLYGTLFMMAGAYTLSRNGHVRGDFLYRAWSDRRQATLDLILYPLFYFPGIIALVYAGWGYFKLSYMLNETSSFSPDGLIVWPFKFLIPLTGVLMVMQGISEVIRCVVCLQTGHWPQRIHDVRELEDEIMAEVQEKGIEKTLEDLEKKGIA